MHCNYHMQATSLRLLSLVLSFIYIGGSVHNSHHVSHSHTHVVDNNATSFPMPNSDSNRILGMVLSLNYNHMDPLVMIVDEYLSMCEGGWDPSIILFSTSDWSPPMRRYITSKSFCYRTNRTIPVQYAIYDQTVGEALSTFHRNVMAHELNNFDVFVYHEDDMILNYVQLTAYLHETKKLHSLIPAKSFSEYIIGFLRYRRNRRYGDIHHVQWGEAEVLGQELLEEEPKLGHTCIHHVPYIHVSGDVHQALWVLTRAQVWWWGWWW